MSNENIIKNTSCASCGAGFVITDQDMEFYAKIAPTFNGVKYTFPTPTYCPDCRQQRRIAWRNERNLYKRKCDLTGKDIISTYSPDKPYKVYDQKERWGTNWDPKSFGIDVDLGASFFEQFKKLDLLVPKMSISIQNSENCDYTNDT
ncbi:MAG: zinc-ribbon domain containing protein [bacterium]